MNSYNCIPITRNNYKTYFSEAFSTLKELKSRQKETKRKNEELNEESEEPKKKKTKEMFSV